MAIVNLNTIKNWFKTGLIPTQDQFWDVWDSYRHKSEKVPVADVEGIDDLISGKADNEAFESHLTDEDAHPGMVDKAMFVQVGKRTVYKHPSNNNPAMKTTQQPNDFIVGFVGNKWIQGFYNSGPENEIESYIAYIEL